MAPQASQSKIQNLYRLAKEHLSGRPPSQAAATEIAEALSEVLGILLGISLPIHDVRWGSKTGPFMLTCRWLFAYAGAIPLSELGIEMTNGQQVWLGKHQFIQYCGHGCGIPVVAIKSCLWLTEVANAGTK